MGKLQILQLKTKSKNELNYVIALNGRIVSKHRTLAGARKKYNKALRIAKS